MPLTPDEVVARTFQPTKFREGYDQAEVDDFLDEVVDELRRLNTENEELRAKLATSEKRCAELSRAAAGSAPQQGERAAVAAVARPAISDHRPLSAPLNQPDHATTAQRPVATPDVATMPIAATAAQPAVAPGQYRPADAGRPNFSLPQTPQPSSNGSSPSVMPSGGGMPAGGTQEAAGMLALAQRLHDEHVRTGERERDRLIGEAKTHADRLVSDAERRKTETLTQLERERTGLERRIDELKVFEREYRSRLKAYLESQMRDLDTQPSVIPGRPPHEVAAAHS